METFQERKCPLALVVDDDPLMRMLVRDALEQSMPGMDGFTACSRLRGLVGGSRVSILVMTGPDDAESIGQAYEQGATDFTQNRLML